VTGKFGPYSVHQLLTAVRKLQGGMAYMWCMAQILGKK